MAVFQNRFLKGSITSKNYFRYSLFLRSLFGENVGKVSVDGGFTCPNRDGKNGVGGCIYCDAYGSGTEKKFEIERQIENQLEKRKNKYNKFLLYFQSFSNTYDDPEKLLKKYEIIKKYAEFVGLIIGTRADCIDEEKLKVINGFTDKYFVQIEYGLQTLDEKIRKWSNRCETLKNFEDAISLTKGFPKVFIGIHIILGLPKEEDNYHLRLADYLNKLEIDGVKIHNLYIPKTSRLAKYYEKKPFWIISMDEFVELTVQFLKVLSNNIVIMRIGGTTSSRNLIAPKWALNKNKILVSVQNRIRE